MAGAVCSFELVRGTGDGEVARLAELQHGHVHLYQLRGAGIGRNALAHRLRTGRLHATLPGVFLVGRPQRDLLGRIMAAALYLKGDALVSARAAAHVWGLLDSTQQLGGDEAVDVLVVGRGARGVKGVRIHRTRALPRQDNRRRHGIPVTSPARTLLDLAGVLDELELEAALLVALRKNLVRLSQLKDVMARNPRAKGVATLRTLLEHPDQLNDTRSGYERKLMRLLRDAELPLPVTNVKVAGHTVDMLWRDLDLVVEFDGWGSHGERDQFETDRLRDQDVTLTGHHTLRVTARQIDRRPYALVARLAGVITVRRLANQTQVR